MSIKRVRLNSFNWFSIAHTLFCPAQRSLKLLNKARVSIFYFNLNVSCTNDFDYPLSCSKQITLPWAEAKSSGHFFYAAICQCRSIGLSALTAEEIQMDILPSSTQQIQVALVLQQKQLGFQFGFNLLLKQVIISMFSQIFFGFHEMDEIQRNNKGNIAGWWSCCACYATDLRRRTILFGFEKFAQ